MGSQIRSEHATSELQPIGRFRPVLFLLSNVGEEEMITYTSATDKRKRTGQKRSTGCNSALSLHRTLIFKQIFRIVLDIILLSFPSFFSVSVHGESTLRSGEVSLRWWFFKENKAFFSKRRGRSLMVSDFLVQHPKSPFFEFTEDEWKEAVEKYKSLTADSDVNYMSRTATATITQGRKSTFKAGGRNMFVRMDLSLKYSQKRSFFHFFEQKNQNFQKQGGCRTLRAPIIYAPAITVGLHACFDNETILNQFERLFQMIEFKREYMNHAIGIVVDKARTHTTNCIYC